MKIYDLKVAKPYKTKQGEEKKAWSTIGKLFVDDNGTPKNIKIELEPKMWDGLAYCYEHQQEGAGEKKKYPF